MNDPTEIESSEEDGRAPEALLADEPLDQYPDDDARSIEGSPAADESSVPDESAPSAGEGPEAISASSADQSPITDEPSAEESNPPADEPQETGETTTSPPGDESSGEEPSETAPSRRRSLSLQIGLLYTIFATINIVFFSVMIFTNQSDLLIQIFKLQADTIATRVLEEIKERPISREDDANLGLLRSELSAQNVHAFLVFDADLNVWHQHEEEGHALPDDIMSQLEGKITEMRRGQSMIHSRIIKELDDETFTVRFLMPIAATSAESEAEDVEQEAFLYAVMSIRTIQDRLQNIYLLMGVAIAAGIVFHAIFAVYVYRAIFRRVGVLKDASHRMAAGELSTRAEWRRGRTEDELDELGNSFNSMAGSIQEKVETISRLNTEIQQELQIGKEVQELFLTPVSMLKDLDLQLFYRPLREVSGDVYKFYDFGDGRRALFFADASGHGVSAALITTITILSLDDVLEETQDPGEVFSQLNNLLATRLDTSFFATGVLFVFDSENNIRVCNAGHNPVMVIRKGAGKVNEIPKMGPPLGLMEDFDYETKSLRTGSGDKFLIYSDGLVETESLEREQYGLKRAVKIFGRLFGRPNKELLDELGRDFTEHSHYYKDDVTFMFLEIP